MYRRLFMADQHMINTADRMQGIINIEDGPRDNRIPASHLIDERSDDHLGSRQHLHGLPHSYNELRFNNTLTADDDAWQLTPKGGTGVNKNKKEERRE
jgi:hypothetical protein